MRATQDFIPFICATKRSRIAAWSAILGLTMLLSACHHDKSQGRTDGGPSGTDAARTDQDADNQTDASSRTDASTESDGSTDPDGSGNHQPLADGSCTDPHPAHSDMETTLRDLPPNSWYQAPGSLMRSVCPDIPDRNCDTVITAWSGGAYDPLHNRMLVFGGGHNDYPGNELYGFDLATLSWARLTDPSPIEYKNQDPLPDGRPVSRHSYGGLQYLTQANRFYAWGGSRWQDGGGTHVTWTFDSDTLQWEDRQPADEPQSAHSYSHASAYDPATGLVFLHVTTQFIAYDYAANRYQVIRDLGVTPLWPRYQVWGDKSCTVDSKRHLLWCLGSGLVMVYDIENDQIVTNDWATTGGADFSNEDQVSGHDDQIFHTTGGEVVTAAGPGLDYDPVADALVAWVGGGPWILDLETKHWHQGSAQGAPAQAAINGTFGRWRYVPRTNVFILVNSVDDNVSFYKHTAGCGE